MWCIGSTLALNGRDVGSNPTRHNIFYFHHTHDNSFISVLIKTSVLRELPRCGDVCLITPDVDGLFYFLATSKVISGWIVVFGGISIAVVR